MSNRGYGLTSCLLFRGSRTTQRRERHNQVSYRLFFVLNEKDARTLFDFDVLLAAYFGLGNVCSHPKIQLRTHIGIWYNKWGHFAITSLITASDLDAGHDLTTGRDPFRSDDKLSAIYACELVAHPGDRQNKLGSLGVFLQLLPQAAHVCVNCTCQRFSIIAPHRPQ